MFFETLYTPGVAHLSYILGDGSQAAVIDPRRDVDAYVAIAHDHGARITHIFETHRNEDYVIGSPELERRTGAAIHHGSQLGFAYGQPVQEGDEFTLGSIRLSILHTPGHTMESISIVYRDLEFGKEPLGVFTGDALFIGDVGRTDFFPDRAEEVAGMLYDSIFDKLLPLGDHVLLWPAHGAGSVCGSGMADRNFSTLGYERKYSTILQVANREEFIQRKTTEDHFKPPYFKQMEKYNLEGAPQFDALPGPQPLPPREFANRVDAGMLAIDVRSPEAFAGAHVPGSFSLPVGMLPAFAGMFLEYDQPLGLVAETSDQMEQAVRGLFRIGYDKIDAFLAGGLHAWEKSGLPYETMRAIHVADLEKRLDEGEEFTLLDVRSKEEFDSGHLRKAIQLYVGDLPSRVAGIPEDRPITTFCGSGQRAMIAAAFLQRQGVRSVETCLGSMSACQNVECEVVYDESVEANSHDTAST